MKEKSISKIIIAFLLICITSIALYSCIQQIPSSTDNNIETTQTEEKQVYEKTEAEEDFETYVLNTRSKKIHKTTCGTGDLILPENRKTYTGDIAELFRKGYTTCGNCFR